VSQPVQEARVSVPLVLAAVVRSFVAVVAGYLLLVLLSTVVQEFWLGGVSYQRSSLTTLILAGIFTPMCAAAAGFATASIARRRILAHASPICLAIAIETTLLYRTGRVDGPLWFEALAGIALIAGVLLGSLIWHRRSARTA
jgi:hypothetical protein